MHVVEEDLKLLNVLQMAPRLSWTDAGRVLDRHPTTLAARWKSLSERGIGWVTAHARLRPEQQTIALVDIESEFANRHELGAMLARIPGVFTVEESVSGRDLMALTVSDSWEDFAHVLLPQISSLPGINRCQSTVCTNIYSTAESWHLRVLSPDERQRLLELRRNPSRVHDEVTPPAFWSFADALARNGRASATELAEASGLHPVTARRQLARVLGSGAMTFRCDVAQSFVGLPVGAQWRARVPQEQHRRAVEVLSQFRGTRMCVSTTGPANFAFFMMLGSNAEVSDVERRFLEAVPEARILECQLTLRFFKRMGWMLGVDSTSTGEVVTPIPTGMRPPSSGGPASASA